MDGGEEPVRDPAEAAVLRRQARTLNIQSVLVALLLTGLALLLPG